LFFLWSQEGERAVGFETCVHRTALVNQTSFSLDEIKHHSLNPAKP